MLPLPGQKTRMRLYPIAPTLDAGAAWDLLLAMAHAPREVHERDGVPVARRDPGGWTVTAEADAGAAALLELYLPVLEAGAPGRPSVVAHLAQSLDGRIAVPGGASQWISGPEDLVHTHRLRALCQAVVVGAETVRCDDPRLTVREVRGPDPLRVVLDSRARLGPEHLVFRDAAAPALRVRSTPAGAEPAPGIEELVLTAPDAVLPVPALLEALAGRGVQRVLVEGGGRTVAGFLEAGCLDRLHLVVAPVLLGAGTPSLAASAALPLDACPRPRTRVLPLGGDWLFDCDLSQP